MHIRIARPADAADITEMAFRSKAHWGYDDDFMAACREEMTVRPEDIANGPDHFVVAEQNNRIVAYYSVSHVQGTAYELESLYVDPVCIGQGVGKKLMNHAKRWVIDHGGETMLVQSDPHAQGFYEAMGGVKFDETPSGSIAGRVLPYLRIQL